jgi:hypothetical protein
MPHSELHKTKFKKNMAMLALVGGFCALLFVITIIKISGAS